MHPLVTALEQARFYVSEDAVRDAIRRRSSFNLIPVGGAKIDVFVCPDREWDRVALQRKDPFVDAGNALDDGVSIAVRSIGVVSPLNTLRLAMPPGAVVRRIGQVASRCLRAIAGGGGFRCGVRASIGTVERRSLRAIFDALNAAEVRYLVVGGLAVIAHGFVRLTLDVDIVLDLEPDNARRALDALQQLGYHPRVPVPLVDFADPSKRSSWIEDKHMLVFSLISPEHPRTVVDLFVSAPFDFDAVYAARVSQQLAPGVSITVVPLDELLRMKREAGRSKDLEDIRCLERIRRDRADD